MMGAMYNHKKDLKASVGKSLRYMETSMVKNEYKPNGSFCVVGPNPYNNRKWYAVVTMKNNIIEKVE